MAQRDTIDFVTAFAVGVVLGVGATLLLRPEPPSTAARILKELDPYRKRIRKSAKRVRKSLGQSAGATAEIGADVVAASRDVVREFRDEMAGVVANARAEIARAVEEETRKALKSARRLRRS